MADKDKDKAAEDAPEGVIDTVETPQEIATPAAAIKQTPAERAAAMAAENASAQSTATGDYKTRDKRADAMAAENAAANTPLTDDDREETSKRAAMMANENAEALASLRQD